MKAYNILTELKHDAERAKRHYMACFHAYRTTKKRMDKSRTSGDMAVMYRSLIDYYGMTEGKRKWANVIRIKRLTLIDCRRKMESAHKQVIKTRRAYQVACEFQHLI